MPSDLPRLTVDNVTEEFAIALPELLRAFLAELADPEMRREDGQPPWHTAFSEALEPVYRMFADDRLTPDPDGLLRRVFAFVDRMLTGDDENLADVASASIVQRLSDFGQIENYYELMSPEMEHAIRVWRDPEFN